LNSKYIFIIIFLNIYILNKGYSANSDPSLKTERLERPMKPIAGLDKIEEGSSDTEGEGPRTPSRPPSRSQKLTDRILERTKERKNKSRIQSSVKSNSNRSESDSDYEGSDSEETKIGDKKTGVVVKLSASSLPVLSEDEEWV